MFGKDELVVKSNSLVEAKMKFTANEYKLITYLTGKIKKDDRKFRTFEISIQELNKYCFGITGTKTYAYMKNQYSYALAQKNIIIKKNTGNLIYNWFTVIDTTSKGTISVCFSPELNDFLLNTKENFTSYRISNILNLDTFYKIRIYEILKQYEKLGKREISLIDLRFMVGIEKNQYDRYRDFKKRILDPSIKSINENTDINASFEEQKMGRNTKSIKFYIVSQKTIYTSKELIEVKEKIEHVINENVSTDILEKTIKKYDLKKEDIYYYLDNWNSFNYKDKENPVGFLLKCIINKTPIPVRQQGNFKPEQSYNFEQRIYDDEFFESLYDNFKT